MFDALKVCTALEYAFSVISQLRMNFFGFGVFLFIVEFSAAK
jgi:hypothetical protein